MTSDEDATRDEYDFSGGIRGKYIERLEEVSNVVVISPELPEEFPTKTAVNEALRELLRVREQRAGSTAG